MKKYLGLLIVLLGVFFISGCSILNTSSSKSVGGVLKSVNSGVDWQFKNKASKKKTISGLNVLQIAIDPIDTQKIYLGTKKKGIAFSDNGAESWVRMKFPATNVYGVVIDPFRPGTIYASGVYRKRAKVFKSTNYGKKWNEVYTEPSQGSLITSLAISSNDSHVLYLGTSNGDIIKTVDGGNTWRKLYSANSLVSQIAFGGNNDKIVYFVPYREDHLLVTFDGGASFKRINGNKGSDNLNTDWNNNKNNNGDSKKKVTLESSAVYSIGVDNADGTRKLYVGSSKGLFRSDDYGKSFVKLDILSDSKKYPIRAIAVNPKNPQEIIYSAAQAIYHSSDGGKQWSTFQLDTDKVVGSIKFNPDDVNSVYAGLRKFGK